MLVISKEEVRRLMPVAQAIEVVGKAYAELSGGTAEIPNRISVSSRGENGTTLIMPGYLDESDGLAVKMVSVFPSNGNLGLLAIHAVVIVFDPGSGIPLALIEGGYLTALRTGASCGLATRLLAREDSESVAIIGAGAQSRLILPSLCAVREVSEVFVYDQEAENAHAFVEELGSLFSGVEFSLVDSSGDAVRDADIVCTATTSSTPVFDGKDLAKGTHINGIGSFTPEMREVGFEAVERCGKIVVDSFAGAMSEAGDLIRSIEEGVINRESIHCEIGEIVAGTKKGRENEDEITFFKSVGNAALDVAVGAAVYKKAVDCGAGVSIDLLEGS